MLASLPSSKGHGRSYPTFVLAVLVPALVSFFFLASPAEAELTVYDPQPITHSLRVQMIQVCNSSGNCATLLGTSSQRDDILEGLNTIWAQSGILVEFLPDVMTWTNNTAYSSATQLSQIASSGPANPDPSVLNLYFVAKSPCHSVLPANSSAGCAFIDGNGVALYVGTGLLTWSGGREVIAKVLAHELGHNLGLNHTGSGTANLMASSGATGEQLSSGQTSTVFTNNDGNDGYDLLVPYTPQSNFEIWKAANAITGDPHDDDDCDGIANVVEFALGLTGQPDASNYPSPVCSPGSNEIEWTVALNPDAMADGISVSFEASYDLENWFILDPSQADPNISITIAGQETTVTSDSGRTVYFRLRAGCPAP